MGTPTTFVNEPGHHPADDFLQAGGNFANDPILGAVGMPEGEDDFGPDLSTPEGAAEAADDRVASLMREVAELKGINAQRDTQQQSAIRQGQIDSLSRQLREKLELGLYGDADVIQAQIAALAANALPQQQPSAAVPWTTDLKATVKNWMGRQDWIGIDGIRTAAMRQVDQVIDPIKFPTEKAYFTAVEKFIADAARVQRGEGQTLPQPTNGAGGARGAPAVQSGSVRDVKSLAELSPRDRAVANQYIGNGLTEATYLASYNETKRNAARAAGRRR